MPGFCLPIGSPDIWVSQMTGPRRSSEEMSPSLLLYSPKPSPASARLDSPESPESQGICKMYVNHPLCTSICTSRVITCRISLISHTEICVPHSQGQGFPPEWHIMLLLDTRVHLSCEPCQNLGSKMSLSLCEAQKRGSDVVTWEAAPRSSGSCHFQSPHPKQRVYPDFCHLMHSKRRNLTPVLPWTCAGCLGFYGTAIIISSFQRTAHKVTGIYYNKIKQ